MAPHLPSHPVARAALLLGVVAGIALGVVGVRGFLERRSQITELERMRSGLGDLRAAAEECRIAVEREERDFEAYRSEVEELREAVRAYEALDERGVPEDRYEEYLETFERYNESVPEWEERADSLRAHSEACRALARRHNLLADSLRDFLADVDADG